MVAVTLLGLASSPARSQTASMSQVGLAHGSAPADQPYAVFLAKRSGDGPRNAAACRALARYSGMQAGLRLYWFGKEAFNSADCRRFTDPDVSDFAVVYQFDQAAEVVNSLQLTRRVGPYLAIVRRGQPNQCFRNLGTLDLTNMPLDQLNAAYDEFDTYVFEAAQSGWREGGDIRPFRLRDVPGWVGKPIVGVFKWATGRGCRPSLSSAAPPHPAP
jgi:hypothetical protein